MAKKIDLTGQKFGRLTVIKRNGSRNQKSLWECECECGNHTYVTADKLKSGKTRSCGCIAIERIINLNKGKNLTDDITGKRFKRLVVIGFSHYSEDKKRTYWKCRCDCGNEIVTRGDSLKSGHTNSCGCYNKDIVAELKPSSTHNLSDTRIFHIWTGMKTRCYNKNAKNYVHYGGRGIKICQEWLDDFMNFYNWAMKNGYRDDLTIDRIDVNGNYEPSNCRWANSEQQANNKTNSSLFTYKGEEKTLTEWSRILGFNYETVKARIYKGIPFEEAIKN